MSFNKAESLAATSGYFRWVADTKSYREALEKQARRPRKFAHKSAHDAQVSALDPAFLLAQARAMNDAQGRANRAEEDGDDAARRRAAVLPSSAARGCDDIFEQTRVRRPIALQAGELFWMTDRTPHESIPLEAGAARQFFRLVTGGIGMWYAAHSTPNPLGTQPEAVVVHHDKFTGKVQQKQSGPPELSMRKLAL